MLKLKEENDARNRAQVKFIDRDPHWYNRRVKEAIHIRLHPNNINRDSRIEIPAGGCPQSNSTTADRYHSGLVREQLLVRSEQ